MKRGILLLVFLALMHLVSAQEITLFNQTYNIILVVPMILIIIALLFFFFLYIKDNSRQLSNLFKITLKLKQRKETQKEHKKEVNYIAEISKFESRYPNLNLRDAFLQFSGIIKDYIKDELNLDREYSIEDLRATLIKKKKTIIPITDAIIHIKYSPHELKKEELVQLIGNFKSILQRSQKLKLIPRERSLFDKLKLKLKHRKPPVEQLQEEIKEPNRLISKLKEEYIESKRRFLYKFIPKQVQQSEPYADVSVPFYRALSNTISSLQLNMTINKAFSTAEKDLNKAEELYSKALLRYYRLPIDIEQRFTRTLIRLHNKIEFVTHKKEIEGISTLKSRIEQAKNVVPREHHNFLESAKIYIENIEEKMKEAEEAITELFNETSYDLKEKLRAQKPEKSLAVPKVKNFIENLKDSMSKIKNKHESGFYKLKVSELNFINNLHELISKIDLRIDGKRFEISEPEQDFLKKAHALLDYISEKNHVPEERLKKLETKIYFDIKRLNEPSKIPIPRKPSLLLKRTEEIKKDLEQISMKPSTISLQKPLIKKRLEILHKSIKLPEMRIPELKIAEKPFKFDHLLNKSKQFRNLSEQEHKIANTLIGLEVTGIKNIKRPQQGAYYKRESHPRNRWESEIEKIRHEIPKKLTRLNEEEQRISKKLNQL